MAIIDFHVHAFPDALAERAMRQLMSEADGVTAYLDGRLTSLLRSMGDNSIEKSVLCCIATRPAQFEPIFRWCQEIASGCIIPFPSIHPGDEQALERIQLIANAGFKGIKMHPYYQDFCIDDPAVYPLYKAMCDNDLMLTLHTGFDIAFERIEKASPRQILSVLTEFPSLKLITTHFGGWQQWDDVQRYLLGKPIFMETSWSLEYLSLEKAREMFLGHSPDHLLFGTDSPWTDQAASIAGVKTLNLPAPLLEKILYQNAKTLLA